VSHRGGPATRGWWEGRAPRPAPPRRSRPARSKQRRLESWTCWRCAAVREWRFACSLTSRATRATPAPAGAAFRRGFPIDRCRSEQPQPKPSSQAQQSCNCRSLASIGPRKGAEKTHRAGFAGSSPSVAGPARLARRLASRAPAVRGPVPEPGQSHQFGAGSAACCQRCCRSSRASQLASAAGPRCPHGCAMAREAPGATPAAGPVRPLAIPVL